MKPPAGLDPVSIARKLVGNRPGARLAAAGLTAKGRLARKSRSQGAREAADTLVWLGAAEQAERTLDAAIEAVSLDEGALLRCRVETMRMSRTRRRLPADRIQALATRALARLDARWALGETELAEDMADVLQLLFHGEVHLADQASPLLDPDTDWLAPLTGSRLGRLLLAADDPAPRPTSGPLEPGRRIAFITQGSRTFLDPLVEALAAHGYETRVLDIAEHPAILKHFSVRELVNRRLARECGERPTVPPLFAEVVEWADVVHAEWGTTTAAMLSMCDAPARKVVRVHAFESRTLWMALIDWRNIDQALFVSPALSRMCQARYPALAANPPAMVRNISDFSRFVQPKTEQANRVAALIGWNSAVKDAAWCLEMFSVLHDAAPSWRLLLVGHDMTGDDEYSTSVRAQIDRLGESVERVAFTREIPALLTRVGVIVSSSLSEGTHEAVAEGAASGALPVVRNWPALAAWGGPREIYPADWIVDTPDQGAKRILQFDDSARAAAGAAASHWVAANLESAASLKHYRTAYFPFQEQSNA